MASLYDNVSKEVIPSDGDDHQLQGELSNQLLTTENTCSNISESDHSEMESMRYPSLSLYRRILTDDESVTRHSDIESHAGLKPQVTPSIWLENEERRGRIERRRPLVNVDNSIRFPYLIEDMNECSWHRIRKSHIQNDEQWKLFNDNVVDTLRLANALVEDRSSELQAAEEKEKSLILVPLRTRDQDIWLHIVGYNFENQN